MFTGIVETTGLIHSIAGDERLITISFTVSLDFSDVKIGDSIAVNGVCLTVTQKNNDLFSVQVVPETLRKTNLGKLRTDDPVNLERSMMASTRIGGHFVQGHVDGVAEIIKIEKEGEALLLYLNVPSHLSHYIIDKGFIAVDGMSLTVISIKKNEVLITLIPHTQAVSVARYYDVGRLLNIEVDMMAKMIEKLMQKNFR
jgi:riboflavin synthase